MGIINAGYEISKWDQALYAFLAEKERRSGSRRTVESYARMLKHSFDTIGLSPNQVTRQDALTT